MKQNIKRALSWLLTLAMMLGMLPEMPTGVVLPVFADSAVGPTVLECFIDHIVRQSQSPPKQFERHTQILF